MKRRIGQYKARVTLFSAVAVVVFTMLMGVAFAADTADSPTSAELTGSSLSISSALTAGTFTGTLDGTAKVLDGTGFNGFSINDARGTGAGWKVTMVATPFVNTTVAGKDLSVNSFTAPQFTVAKADGTSSDVPGTRHLAAKIDTGGAGVVMAECDAHGQGMGTYDFTAAGSVPWKLAITADEYAGTYYSTVATTVATLAL